MPDGFTDYTGGAQPVAPPQEGGWPAYASQDIAPMESPMERFVKGLGAISGGKFGIVRSRQDVWKEKHDTGSYIDRYLQDEERGQVARQSMAQGLPKTQTEALIARDKLDTARGAVELPNVGTMENERVAQAQYNTEHLNQNFPNIKSEAYHTGLGLAHQNELAQKRDDWLKDQTPEMQKRVTDAEMLQSFGVPNTAMRGQGNAFFDDYDTAEKFLADKKLTGKYQIEPDTFTGKWKVQPTRQPREEAIYDAVAEEMQAKDPNVSPDQITQEMFRRFPRLRFSPTARQYTPPSVTMGGASNAQLVEWEKDKSAGQAQNAVAAHKELVDRQNRGVYNPKWLDPDRPDDPEPAQEPSWWQRIMGGGNTTPKSNSITPSDVQDARSGGTSARQPVRQPQKVEFATTEEAQAAIESGKLQKGDTVVVNGQEFEVGQ